jgi:hypothetical protein
MYPRRQWSPARLLLIVRYVPQPAIAGVLGDGSRFAVVIAALDGIRSALNNVAALPIVSRLLAQGMQPGAAVAFLIAGPVTTVPAMSAVWGVRHAARVRSVPWGFALRRRCLGQAYQPHARIDTRELKKRSVALVIFRKQRIEKDTSLGADCGVLGSEIEIGAAL